MTAGFPPEIVDAALALPPRYEFSEEGVSSALAALGTTPAQVADTLFQLGVRGRRGSECGCVMAEWARVTFPTVTYAAVTKDEQRGEAYMWLVNDDGEDVDVDMPQPAAAVVIGFDLGQFPQLDVELAEVTA